MKHNPLSLYYTLKNYSQLAPEGVRKRALELAGLVRCDYCAECRPDCDKLKNMEYVVEEMRDLFTEEFKKSKYYLI